MVIFLEIHLEIFEMTKLSTTNRNSEDIYLFIYLFFRFIHDILHVSMRKCHLINCFESSCFGVISFQHFHLDKLVILKLKTWFSCK